MHLKAFFLRRLDRTTFIGLPLLLLSVLFLILLFVFFDLVEDILESEKIVQIDLAVATLLSTLRTPALTSFFLFITELGNSVSMAFWALLAGGYYFFFSKRHYVFPLALITLGVSSSVSWIKFLVARDRPLADVAVYIEKLFSFPSGHAAVSLTVFGFIAYVFIKTLHTKTSRMLVLSGTLLLVGAIGFSRLYLGVHFLSDVLGGYVLGSLWLIIGICIVELSSKLP